MYSLEMYILCITTLSELCTFPICVSADNYSYTFLAGKDDVHLTMSSLADTRQSGTK